MSIAHTRFFKWIAVGAISAAAVLGAASASARDLAVSVGIHVPGVAVGVSPVYYEPPHRHYRPAPVYYGHRPHHHVDRGYYHRPPPRHFHRHEYRHGHRHHHGHRHDRHGHRGYRY
jgi:hypothetical protein